MILATFFPTGSDARISKLVGLATVAYFALSVAEYTLLGTVVAISAGFVLFFGASRYNSNIESVVVKLLYFGLMFVAMMFILVPPF